MHMYRRTNQIWALVGVLIARAGFLQLSSFMLRHQNGYCIHNDLILFTLISWVSFVQLFLWRYVAIKAIANSRMRGVVYKQIRNAVEPQD